MKRKTVSSSRRRFISRSPRDTQSLAAKIARRTRAGDVLLLLANLGVGKTTFAQGFVRALGVKETALSPTFILAQSFRGRIPIHHLDFYRATPKELIDMGVQDYLTGGGALEKGAVLIEWAERCRELWPAERIEIKMTLNKKSLFRSIELRGVGVRPAQLVRSL